MPEVSNRSFKNTAFLCLRWCPALIPPLLILLWMREYLVNVPFMDDYVWLPFFQKFHDGTFKWNDLMFVQMEHRLTVPALLNWIFYRLHPGQITLYNWASFVELCLTGVNLVYILRRTMPGLESRWLLVTAGSAVLFSPTQYSTLLWCDCFSSYLAPLLITSAIAALLAPIGVWTRLTLCVTFAVLSSISFGSGLLAWPLLVPLILWTDAIPGRRQRWIFLALWLVSCVVTMKLYFIHLDNQALPLFSYEQGPTKTFGGHLREFMVDPWLDLQFIVMFGGAMLGRGSFAPIHDASLVAGVLLALLLIAACIPLLWGRDKSGLRSQTLPWIVIGLYSFVMGGMVAMSRIYARPGLTGALFGRYAIHSVFIVIALLVLGWFWWRRLAAEGTTTRQKSVAAAAPFIFGLLAMQLWTGWVFGAQMMESWWSSRLRDATCQLFLKSVPAAAIQGPLVKTQSLAVRMDNLGLLRPPMPLENRLDQFTERPRVIESSAKLEAVEPMSSGEFSAGGIAFVRGQSRPADGVLLCYKDDAGAWRIFAVGQVKQPPLFLRDALYADMQYLHIPRPGLKQTSYGQWEVEFKARKPGAPPSGAAEIPAGAREVAAWVFDFQRQTVARMAGTFRVDGEKMTVERIEEDEPPPNAR